MNASYQRSTVACKTLTSICLACKLLALELGFRLVAWLPITPMAAAMATLSRKVIETPANMFHFAVCRFGL